MALPDIGTAARENLESQTISLAERLLHEHESITRALMYTHDDLMERGHNHQDSAILVHHVEQVWITKIVEYK